MKVSWKLFTFLFGISGLSLYATYFEFYRPVIVSPNEIPLSRDWGSVAPVSVTNRSHRPAYDVQVRISVNASGLSSREIKIVNKPESPGVKIAPGLEVDPGLYLVGDHKYTLIVLNKVDPGQTRGFSLNIPPDKLKSATGRLNLEIDSYSRGASRVLYR